jgi:hypothetical protein
MVTYSAWDLIGFDGSPETTEYLTSRKFSGGVYVRIVGGRALYEAVIYNDETGGQNVRLARLDSTPEGLRQTDRYVDADTRLELVGEECP